MRLGHLGLVGTLGCALLLSGCAAAVMAVGPVAMPAAMLVMAPLEEMGLFDGAPGVATNPALRNHPDLGDAGLSAKQAELISRHAAFTVDPESRLSAANALACSLDDATVWLFAYGSSRRDYEAFMASLPPESRPRSLGRAAALLEGDCVGGRPEGAFVAVASHASLHGTGTSAVSTADRRRLSGTMRDGALDGRFILDAVTTSESNSLGRFQHSVSHTVSDFTAGEQRGRRLHVSFDYDKAGEVTKVLTRVDEQLSPTVTTVTVYAGPARFQEFTMQDGQFHGWMVSHPVEFVAGYPSEASRVCYRFGQQSPDAACSTLAAS